MSKTGGQKGVKKGYKGGARRSPERVQIGSKWGSAGVQIGGVGRGGHVLYRPLAGSSTTKNDIQ